MELFKKIIKWGVVPVLGLASFSCGLVSATKEASTWGLPAYAWVAVGCILFAAMPIAFGYGMWKDNQKFRAELKQEEQNVKVLESQLNAKRSSAVGGLIGRSLGGCIENCSAKGKITVNGDSRDVDVGGLVGQSQDTKIINSEADVEIKRSSESHPTDMGSN